MYFHAKIGALPYFGLLLKRSYQPGLGLAQTRSPGLHLGLPHVWQRPTCRSHHLLLAARVHIHRMVNLKGWWIEPGLPMCDADIPSSVLTAASKYPPPHRECIPVCSKSSKGTYDEGPSLLCPWMSFQLLHPHPLLDVPASAASGSSLLIHNIPGAPPSVPGPSQLHLHSPSSAGPGCSALPPHPHRELWMQGVCL